MNKIENIMLKGLVDEDFVNYRKPSMFLSTCKCDWKCCIESNIPIEICQNCDLTKDPNISISIEKLYNRYINNPIAKAILIGGLEPMLQQDEVYALIKHFRIKGCLDDIVIYTGYEDYEIAPFLATIKAEFTNIYIKFGRFIPDQKPHYDEILGVNLCSDNQRGVKIC